MRGVCVSAGYTTYKAWGLLDNYVTNWSSFWYFFLLLIFMRFTSVVLSDKWCCFIVRSYNIFCLICLVLYSSQHTHFWSCFGLKFIIRLVLIFGWLVLLVLVDLWLLLAPFFVFLIIWYLAGTCCIYWWT